MKTKMISSQFQPPLAPGVDAEWAIKQLGAPGADVQRFTEGSEAVRRHAKRSQAPDNVVAINVNIKTLDLAREWKRIQRRLKKHPELAKSTTVVCEGEHGWDDYLLLHSYDESEPLDQLK